MAAAPPEGPAGSELRSWHLVPAGGAGAREVRELVEAAVGPGPVGRLIPAVRLRYGVAGVVAALGIAAVVRIEEAGSPPLVKGAATALPEPPSGNRELADLTVAIRRSFGEVPRLWRLLSWDPSAARRWWALHEAALLPGLLTGQEKWLAVTAVAGAAGAPALGAPYRRLLLEGGWSEEELSKAFEGRSRRVRPAVGSALPAASLLAAGAVDPPRAEVRAASLPEPAAAELFRLAALVRGLAAYRTG